MEFFYALEMVVTRVFNKAHTFFRLPVTFMVNFSFRDLFSSLLNFLFLVFELFERSDVPRIKISHDFSIALRFYGDMREKQVARQFLSRTFRMH